MKKIVALVLSLVMVLGLATTAFGATATKTWNDKYFQLTGADTNVYTNANLVYYAPVALTYDDDTGLVNNTANVPFYYIDQWDAKYVEVTTLGEADVVVYNNVDAAGKGVGLFKYLKLAKNVEYIGNGVAFNDFGKACGQYKAVPTADTKYYSFQGDVYEGVVASATALMVDGKLVPVTKLADKFVDHVATYTYDAKFKVTEVKCAVCGKAAVIAPNYASVPVAELAGAVALGDGRYYYFPAVAVEAPEATDKVESAQTFDAGIAMYVGMSVMAAAGSAVVLKKKD